MLLCSADESGAKEAVQITGAPPVRRGGSGSLCYVSISLGDIVLIELAGSDHIACGAL